MTADMEGVIALDQLKDHYKHCIRLSASNKINQKNAFDLKLIDYMQDLVNFTDDRQLNFKIASSALDVGAKIYSNRVDNIQSEAQKVASSILMALDGQQGKINENPDDTQLNDSTNSDRVDDDHACDDQKKTKKKRPSRGKNVKTVVEDKNLLDAKLEKMVLGDPFLDGLSQEYDMSCPAALISYNSLTQPEGLLTIESSHLRINFKDKLESTPPNASSLVTLITKHNVNCAKIIRDNLNNQICPKLESFLFNDRTTKITGNTSAQEFKPEEYGDDIGGDANDCDDHFDCNDSVQDPQDNNDQLDLDKIAASKPTEYFYPNHRLMNTWAGPHAWKVVKEPQTAKNPRKRVKLEQKVPEDYKVDFDENLVVIADKEIRHSSVVLRRWKKVFMPQDHSWDEEKTYVKIKHTLLKPEEVYECTKTTPVVENDSTNEPMDTDGVGFNSPGFDDVHDSDDEFRADPVLDGKEVGIYGADINNSLTFQADLEFAGEHLIEQPYTVAQVNIPFAKMAKKMDVRKLKRVMWDLLAPPESHNVTVIMNGDVQSTGGDTNGIDQDSNSKRIPTPCETPVHLEFSNLYGELPVRVNSKMANDLSQPIAFVTLLHLANEKNLKLIPKEDLKDFVIEQD